VILVRILPLNNQQQHLLSYYDPMNLLHGLWLTYANLMEENLRDACGALKAKWKHLLPL